MKKRMIAVSLALLSYCNVCLAETLSQQVLMNGMANHFRLKVEPKKTNKLTVWALSFGKESTVVDLDILLPAGSLLNASAIQITRGFAAAYKAKASQYYPVTLYPVSWMPERHAECPNFEAPLEGAPTLADNPPSWSDKCELFTREELQAIADQFTESYGEPWTVESVCTYVSKLIGDVDWDGELPTLSTSSLSRSSSESGPVFNLTGLLKKNVCSSGKNDVYLFRLDITIPHQLAPLYPEGAYVYVSMLESSYSGSKQSSLKPTSDGMFAPKPIAIMEWMKKVCGNKLIITKWQNGKPKDLMEMDAYGLLRRNGTIFTRTLIKDGVLKGGKGNFDVYDGTNVYSVCFDLARKRQNKNGYQ